jgi:hypothetical protein
MSVDAVFLLRAPDATFLAAAGERGLLVTPLADGAAMVNSFLGYAGFARDRIAASEWLRELGGIEAAAADPRGILVFPDAGEPRGRTYDEVVTEAESAGFWLVPTPPLSPAEKEARLAATLAQIDALVSEVQRRRG